jgi:hypothetical protein
MVSVCARFEQGASKRGGKIPRALGPGVPGKLLRFWKYENQNSSVATWLTIMEVVLHASQLFVERERLLSQVFCDRRQFEDEPCTNPMYCKVFQAYCLSQYQGRATLAPGGSEKNVLPYVFYEDLDAFLGPGTLALAAFSCLRVASVPVGAAQVDAAQKSLRDEAALPAICHVEPGHRESVDTELVAFLGLVVGELPQLLHVVMEDDCMLAVVRFQHVMEVPRLDDTFVARKTCVTYTLAAAVCINGSQYKATVVDSEGVLWDYDCVDGGCLVERPCAPSIAAAQGFFYKCLIYRLESETPIIAGLAQRTPQSETGTGTTLYEADSVVSPPLVFVKPAFADHSCPTPTSALVVAPPGSLSPGKRKLETNTCGDLSPGLSSRHSLKAPTMTPDLREKNMVFVRECTGQFGYKYVVSPVQGADVAKLQEQAHFLASQVLLHSDQYAHRVHKPGPPNKPFMWYFKFEGQDPGGKDTARVTRAALYHECHQAHDALLKHVMQGSLQRHLDAGLAYICHTGFLVENIETKRTRNGSSRDPEGYTRYRKHNDGTCIKERVQTDAERLYADSSGAAGFSWPTDGLLKKKNGCVGACHVDSWNRVDEAAVVVIITLTEHGGVYLITVKILLPYTGVTLIFVVFVLFSLHRFCGLARLGTRS